MQIFPDFTLNVPVVGNTWTVGIAFQFHLVIVAFIMGIAILAPVAEFLGLRRQGVQQWERLARDLAAFIAKLFAFGATWAVFGLVALFGLYPRLFGVLTGIFFWPLVVVGGIWFIMSVSSYGYYYSWDRLADRRGLHMAIGWTFALSTFIFISLIIFLSSYQLTPANPDILLAAALNPSWPTEAAHRHVGNLSYAGVLLAAYAGVRFLYFGGEENDRAYLDWLGHTALLIGVGLALLQPIGGWFYVNQIKTASFGAWVRMMPGENGWMFQIQIGLLGTAFLLGNLYMALAMERGNPSPPARLWVRYSLAILGLLIGLAVLPGNAPLGAMNPWKYVALAAFILSSVINLVIYLRSNRNPTWGRIGRGSQRALVGLGIVLVALMVIMGIIRESARGPYLIYDRMPPAQSQEIERP